jgi:hypothetical protein
VRIFETVFFRAGVFLRKSGGFAARFWLEYSVFGGAVLGFVAGSGLDFRGVHDSEISSLSFQV